MDQQHGWIPDRMRGIRRMLPRRVMLQIDPRQPPLLIGEQLVLVIEILAALEHDAVQVQLMDVFRSHIMDVAAEGELAGPADVAPRAPGLDRKIKLMIPFRLTAP